jgi:hypothetical protein
MLTACETELYKINDRITARDKEPTTNKHRLVQKVKTSCFVVKCVSKKSRLASKEAQQDTCTVDIAVHTLTIF